MALYQGKPVIEPIPFNALSYQDKCEALEAVNLIAQEVWKNQR